MLTAVIATMSSRGQIVIPQALRRRCDLGEGDHFLVEADAEHQTITLRKVKAPGDWVEVYLQCPAAFEVPPRRKQFPRSRHELAR